MPKRESAEKREGKTLRSRHLRAVVLLLLLTDLLAFFPFPTVSSTSGGTLFTDFSYPYPTDDSWVELARPDTNHARDREIYVKTDSTTVRRSYLKFDLSVIPTEKVIISAKLYLYCVTASPTYNIQVDIHRTEDNWNEHNITWNNAPLVGAFVSSNTTVDGKYKFYSWDITSYAQSEYDGDKILSAVVKLPIDDPAHPELNPNYYKGFASKEYRRSTRRPFLEIEYTEPQEPPVADFTYSPACPSVNETVTFNASSSYDLDGYITSYRWDFGDENITTVGDSVITHVYTVANSTVNYTVTLTVTDDKGFTNSTTDIVTVINPSILRVSLPAGEDRTGISDPDPWLSECWLLNITGASVTFTVRINNTAGCIKSYDTHLIIALNDAAYNNLVSLSVNGTPIGKFDFKYGTVRPYNIWTWPCGDVYPTWFNDTLVNVGTIPLKGYADVTVSVTFSNATGVRMHFDAYGSKYPCPPTKCWQKCYITHTPISEDSTVLFWPPPPPPLSVSISPTSVVMDVGQSQLFTSSVSGGIPPYTYQWYLDGTPVGTDPTWAFTPTSSGSYEVYLNVTDDVGVTVESDIASVTVNPALMVSISPTTVTMDVGQSQLFTSAVSGGTPPYSYQWYLNGAPVSGATSSEWTFIPTSAGVYSIFVNVTDNVGVTAMSNVASVTVNPELSVSISPTLVTMNLGDSQMFASSVSGGTLPYSYQWYLDGTPVLGATDPTWTFIPNATGSYTVYLNVTDSVGVTAQSNLATVWVNPTLVVSISPTSVVMDVGQSQLFSSSVSGGTSPYSYQWYLNGAPVSGATSSEWTFTPASSGSYEVYVNVTDNIGVTAISNVASVTVNPELSVSISPISVAMNLGGSKMFTSSVSNGTPPYTYQWYLDNAPVSGANASTWAFTPTATGSYTVYLNVTDSVSVTAKSNVVLVTVNPPLEVSIELPPSVVMDVGQSQLFTSSVSGGTPPYTYQWYLDGAPVGTDPTWTFTPTSPGSYEVYVIVADSSDPAESNHVIVIVNPPLEVSISPLSVVMDVGQSQPFTSSVSGGTSPYTYQWYLDGTPVGTDPTWAFTPTSSGSYEVYLNVTDSVNVTVKSDVASVTVNPPLEVSITPMSVTMDVGESQLFTSTVSNGTPPYTYQWYLNGTAVLGANSSSWTFDPTSPGFYLVHLKVTDDADMSVESDIASVTVKGRPKAAFIYQPLYPFVNETVTFNASASTPNGGVISNYTWYFGDDNITVVTDPVITHAYTTEGTYTVTLVVTDSDGLEDATSKTITVYLPELYSMDYTAHSLDEEFLINVVVVNVTNVYSFEFKLGYNTTLLDAINVTEGPFLKSLGNTSFTMEIHDSEGYVWVSVTLLGPAPPAEPRSGILATIKFKVTYATVYPETVGCSLELYDTELDDPIGEPIPHTIHDGWYEFVPLPPPCEGPMIDVFTQKPDPYSGKGRNMPSDAFGPQEEVILYAYVSYNCEPVENKLVVFEVRDPSSETVAYRTAATNSEGIATSRFRIPWEGEEAESLFGEWTIFGSVDIAEQKVNDTCTFQFGWIVEITEVETVDINGNPKTSFTKGEHIHFNITIRNIAFTSKTATCVLVIYDECDVPIGRVVLQDWSISAGTTQFFIIDLQIPNWAFVGVATVYANAYTEVPQLYGTPYCPETSVTFVITQP